MRLEPNSNRCFYTGYIFLCTVIILFPNLGGNSAAWTLAKGKGLLITEFLYQSLVPSIQQQSRALITQKVLKAYTEYGLQDDLTLGFSPHFILRNNQQTNVKGFAYADIFLRKRLYSGQQMVISLQPSIKAPGSKTLGMGFWSSELRLLAGISLNHYLPQWWLSPAKRSTSKIEGSDSDIFQPYSFINSEIAVKKHFADKGHEWQLDLTLGTRPTSNTILLSEAFLVYTPLNDFYSATLKLSTVRPVTDNISLQIGTQHSISSQTIHWEGKQHSQRVDSSALLVALWMRF